MSDEIEQLAARLVIGRKRDGRNVYDEQAKAELVRASRRPGVSLSKLAGQCGVNANQLSRWAREHERKNAQALLSRGQGEPEPVFVPMLIGPPAASAPTALAVEVRLPNGVILDLRGCALQQLGQIVQALGSLRCSASMPS
jgi:transposase